MQKEEPLKNNISHKKVMVPNADTVIYPRTMVVETLNTSVADGTMSTANCSNRLAIRTQIHGIKAIEEFLWSV